MLYGKDLVQNEIIMRVKQYERQSNSKVLFGAMLGSISKGMGRIDSDYDSRFLYVKNNNLDFKKEVPNYICEKDIHHCFYPEREGLFYDKIGFWEITSFLSFLVNPCLDGTESSGLYHTANWTMRSPFVWDPYGLVAKLQPFLENLFNEQYETTYYLEYINRALNREKILLREYLYSVFYVLSIQWCINKKSFAPIYLPTLLSFCEDKKLVHAVNELMHQYRETAHNLIRSTNSYARKVSNQIPAIKNSYIDEFLRVSLEEINSWYETIVESPKRLSNEEGKKILRKMYTIIADSLKDEKILGVND